MSEPVVVEKGSSFTKLLITGAGVILVSIAIQIYRKFKAHAKAGVPTNLNGIKPGEAGDPNLTDNNEKE